MLDSYNIRKGLTALADNEVEDAVLKNELLGLISGDKRKSFEYEVQKQISANLRENIIKHPLPYKLNKKLNKILSPTKGGIK